MMEVVLIAPNIIKIKSKNASFIVDPLLTQDRKSVKGFTKTAADAVLLLSGTPAQVDASRLEEIRLVTSGPGDYEVGGVKVSALLADSNLSYHLRVDSGEVAISKAENLKSLGDKIKECSILIVNAHKTADASHITAFSSLILIIYGEKAEELIKTLGNDEFKKTSKVQITPDKMPQEIEVYLLE